MPLINILSELATDEGFDINKESNRSYLIDIINKAAKDFYAANDLKLAYREQYFFFDRNTQLVTFPWQVSRVCAIRNVDQYLSIATIDMSARYRVYDWPMTLNYRLIGEKATAQSFIDASPVTFYVDSPAVVNIELIIVGRVSGSQRKTERLTILAGQQTVTTAGIYEPGGIESLLKPALTVENIGVYVAYGTIDQTLIATILNVAEKSRYIVCQAFDIYYIESQDPLIECYYKHEFVPMFSDFDSFIAGDRFDQAIYWQARAKLLSKDEKRKDDCAGYLMMAKKLAVEQDNDYKQDEISRVIASPNPMQQAMEDQFRGYLVPRRSQW